MRRRSRTRPAQRSRPAGRRAFSRFSSLWTAGRSADESTLPVREGHLAPHGRIAAMRIGIIGGGVIARLVLEHRAELGGIEVAGILGRSKASRGKTLAAGFGAPYVTSLGALIALKPEAVIEAASHDAVRQHAAPLLVAGIPVIVL